MRKVYVADDDPAMRQLLTMGLEALPDLEIQVFDNGLDLLRAVQEDPPDLVVSDILLPRLEGLALTSLLKFDDSYRHIPVLVVSSVLDRNIAQQVKDVGAEAFLHKPFRPAELRQQVTALLEPRSAPS